MNSKAIKLYYAYFVPITIIQSLTSLLLITFFSINDYGRMTLYLSNINLFFVIGLGLQFGYTICFTGIRNVGKYTKLINRFANVVVYVYLLIAICYILVLKEINILTLSFMSASIHSLVGLHKSIFQTNIQIHKVNIYTLMYNLVILVDIIAYQSGFNFEKVIIIDVFTRALVACVGNILIKKHFSSIDSGESSDTDVIKRTLRSGAPILLGNWVTMSYLLMDKYTLRNDMELLGLYSFAFTIIVLFRVLVTPIRDLIFVSLASKTESSISNQLKSTLIISFILVIIGFIGVEIVMTYTPLFEKYREAKASLLILIGILPMSICLDVILFNLSRVKSGPKFLILSVCSAVVMFLSLSLYMTVTKVPSLEVFSILVLLNYFAVFTIFLFDTYPKLKTIKYSVILGIFEIIYLIIISIFIV